MKPRSYRRFSCPRTEGDDLATPIAVIHGAGSVEFLLKRKREAIRARTQGLTELLERWLTSKI